MARDAAGLTKALELIPALREEFWKDVMIPGSGAGEIETRRSSMRVVWREASSSLVS